MSINRSNTQGRCSKCGGNLYIDRDPYGWYEQCLQCGFTCDLKVVYKDGGKTVFAHLEKLEFNGKDD